MTIKDYLYNNVKIMSQHFPNDHNFRSETLYNLLDKDLINKKLKNYVPTKDK